jgi:hypothetical protein
LASASAVSIASCANTGSTNLPLPTDILADRIVFSARLIRR